MNLFTVNQVSQVYVVPDGSSVAEAASGLSSVGDVFIGTTPDGKSRYIVHKGAGGVTRSDLIDIDKIMSVTHTAASKMAYKLKTATVTLSNDVLDDSKPIAGQDYILRIAFDGYVGISPEDSTYWKYGVVHVTNGMTKSDFYKQMALSIAKNMSREAVQLIKVYLGATEVTHLTDPDDLTSTYTSVIIKEVEPDWVLGTKQQKRLKFTVTPTGVDIVEGTTVNTVTWGSVAYSDGSTVGNGKLMADLEYFFMGERGDQYRMVGFPDYVPTKYLVDPTSTYDVINIHYAYVGSNESVQKSEKDIILIVEDDETAEAIANAIQGIEAEEEAGSDNG